MTKIKLHEWILEQELSDDDKNQIRSFVNIFSEYLASTNPDYLYNKTYLPSYIDDFFKCQNNLKKKYNFLKNDLLIPLKSQKVDMQKVIIKIDGAWVAKNEIYLMDSFSIQDAIKNELKIELIYTGKKDFVITDKLQIEDSEIEKKAKDIISRFINFIGDDGNDN